MNGDNHQAPITTRIRGRGPEGGPVIRAAAKPGWHHHGTLEDSGKARGDPIKLRDLAHYVIWRVAGFGECSAARLFKILWCSEINSYVRSGKFITGVRYVRSRHGLRPICWDDTCRQLVLKGCLRYRTEQDTVKKITKYSIIQTPIALSISEFEAELVNTWVSNIDDFLDGRKSMIFQELEP